MINKLTEAIVEDSWQRYKQIKSFANRVFTDEDLSLDTRWKWLLQFGEHSSSYVRDIPHIDIEDRWDYERYQTVEIDSLIEGVEKDKANDIKEFFCKEGIKSFTIDW